MSAAVHRDTDRPSEDHVGERSWNGPTESQWDALCCSVDKLDNKLDNIHVALFGEERKGINSDGGIVGEVRSLRKIRVVAWSGLTGIVGMAAKLLIDSLGGKGGAP